MGDIRLGSRDGDLLITRSLGSCVAVVLYARRCHLGGLLHCSLPDSSIDRNKALLRPGTYVDTAIATLVGRMLSRGATRGELCAKLVGGAAPLDDGGIFRIGRRNVAAARKALWKQDVLLEASDVGGKAPRTVTLHLPGGETIVRTLDQEYAL
jgi:chemotaxis protein CheD